MIQESMKKDRVGNQCVCPQCADGHVALYHGKLRYDQPGAIYQCNRCDFVFLYPRLSEEDQAVYYETEYRDDYKDDDVAQRFVTDQPEGLLRLNRILEKFSKSASLLEVGSGSGAFLSLASKAFDKVVGIEPDVRTRNFLKDKKNITVHHDLSVLKDEKFDLIVMFHVLEHLLDPVGFLKNISKNLKDGGSIIIEVPNIDDALVSFYNIKEFKDFYFCTAHVSYFSMKTLNACFSAAGLTGEILPIQRYNLSNHIHWLMHKKPETLLEHQNILSEKTLNSYEKDLFSRGLSDTLWAVVNKS